LVFIVLVILVKRWQLADYKNRGNHMRYMFALSWSLIANAALDLDVALTAFCTIAVLDLADYAFSKLAARQ
jgi:hypothetical protein